MPKEVVMESEKEKEGHRLPLQACMSSVCMHSQTVQVSVAWMTPRMERIVICKMNFGLLLE